MNIVKVVMADLNFAKAPDRLKTTGLGSCVGIVLFDGKNKLGAMAHIMLPSSNTGSIAQVNKAKYADTAIPVLLEELLKLGATRNSIIAKIAGGAQMFQFNSTNDMMRIGPRNVEATKLILKELGIPLISQDTGGNIGRTVELDTVTGILYVKTVNQGVSEI